MPARKPKRNVVPKEVSRRNVHANRRQNLRIRSLRRTGNR